MYVCMYVCIYCYIYLCTFSMLQTVEREREQSQEEQSQIKCCHVLIGRISNQQSAISNQQSAISNQYPESSKKAVISFLCFSILLVMRTALMLLLVQKQLANSWERRRKAPEKGAVYLDKCILGVTEAVHTRQSCRPSTMENKVYCFMWHSILKSWRLYTKAEPFTPKRNHLHQSWENNVPFIFLIKRQSRSQLL